MKYHFDGTVKRYKAHLIAKGHTQIYGVNHAKTFSPIAKIGIVPILISLAATLGWQLFQLDVKTAFLHGDL